MSDHDPPDTDHPSSSATDQADLDSPWGFICPDCSFPAPFSDPEETDLEQAMEEWTCPDCGHSDTPAVAPTNPGTGYDDHEAIRQMERAFYTHPCSRCAAPLVVYGTPSELTEDTSTCESCGTGTELSSEELTEATLGFNTISKDDLHLWRTEDRGGVMAGLHVLYGDKEETKARIRDRRLRNQHGHGPMGSLHPGRDYDDVEYLGTLAEHAAKPHDEPLITRPGLPEFSDLLSNPARREVRANLAEFVTGCLKVNCDECSRTYAYFGIIGDVESPQCGECGSEKVILRDER
ncbi:hypothetical protein [Halobacterium rubrum]|uniref:hypothetical protein n=1 Tax=Halobacterium TaxID=2239 RepID=UPI001F474305|nr:MULTISPECIES: hypothetical protein [Halobacterium]MDH5021792.1 hypothetical protein [Halobacterium rubrum]